MMLSEVASFAPAAQRRPIQEPCAPTPAAISTREDSCCSKTSKSLAGIADSQEPFASEAVDFQRGTALPPG